MRDSLRYVDVQDLATGGEHIPELGDVYVDVAVVSRAAHRVSDDRFEGVTEDTSERHSFAEFLDRRGPAVLALVGQPGSGKSTLLAHAAFTSAQRGSLGQLGRGQLARGCVPILLALREQAPSISADPAISLPDVVRAAIEVPGKEPSGWWERQLGRGRCLVLLDGLDEVASASDRFAVAEWVERQIAAYPGNPFVITSRSFGLPDPLTAKADVLVVRQFTAEQVQLFLDRWYLAAERHATGASDRSARRAVRIRARESAAKLTTLLRERPALYDLAANPLLLTMIAAANRYRGALPDSRADLYGEICHVLLSRRDQAKGLPELLPWRTKQMLLAALAYRMMRGHVSEFPADRIMEILKPQLERFPLAVTGETFLADISRSGLLFEVAAGRYAFTHLTFQEYLAARHVGANPDLLKNLTSSVSDPWWHETILLYASTADASPIVRACLDSGTIPALTLAFDCAEASSEIDPDLRRRLDRERARAYEPDCSPEHRRLIAGVAATRLMRHTLSTAAGSRICARPVPADLYWLFLQDTGAPQPDSPCAPRADQPATGIWGMQAQAFVKWLNSITATGTGIEVRLPDHDELHERAIASTLTSQLPATVTSAWTAPHPGLWLVPGQPHPHELTGAAISQAVAVDAEKSAMLPQILTAAVLDVAVSITRDLEDIRAMSRALTRDLAARAKDGQVVDLMHAHAHSIVLTYTHALNLTRAAAITRTCAADADLIRTLDLTRVRALASAIARELASAIALAHTRAVELAEAVDRDLSVLSAFDFDLAHVRDISRVHAADLDTASALARGIPRAADVDLKGLFGLTTDVQAVDPALPLPGILGLPLRWVAEGPLASTLLQVLAVNPAASASGQPASSDPYRAFALELSSRAGIAETTQLRATLGRPLTGALHDLTAAEFAKSDSTPDGTQVTGISRLSEACAPMCRTHRLPDPSEAAAIRAVALALAGSPAAGGTDAAGVLRAVAATVTLVESRGNGESTTGESVILALR